MPVNTCDMSNMKARVEGVLEEAIGRATEIGAPPHLSEALHAAIFPGGARVRPRLCLAVATACGDSDPALTNAAAAAIEMLHCASLVHDDMPCFDNAETRRGHPTVHRLFGEATALLVGDALIVLAFETLTLATAAHPARAAPAIAMLSRAVGMPSGIIAGQAWEEETHLTRADYHRAKTGALFVGAATLGAFTGGGEAPHWRAVGEKLGEAYQVADDLSDAAGKQCECGKPTQQDLRHGRPNVAAEIGVDAALAYLRALVAEAVAAIPACRGAGALRVLIANEAIRLVPKTLAHRAA